MVAYAAPLLIFFLALILAGCAEDSSGSSGGDTTIAGARYYSFFNTTTRVVEEVLTLGTTEWRMDDATGAEEYSGTVETLPSFIIKLTVTATDDVVNAPSAT